MTKQHREILNRANQYERDLSNDPWATRAGGSYVTVTDRMAAIRTMGATELVACLNWPSTQMSVKCAIETRLNQLRRKP
jgi:hypothetical protein